MAVLHDPEGRAVRPAILMMNWRTSELKTKRSAFYSKNPRVLHILSLSANVATDGAIMAVLHDPEGRAVRPAILMMNWRTSELKTKRSAFYSKNPRVLHILSLSANVGTIKMRDGGEEIATVVVNEITKKFPVWRRVLPTDASKEYPWCRSSYNMEKLTAIHKAITLLNGNKTGLDILPGKNFGPAIVRHEGPADAVFVIMPKRGSAGVYVPPAWLYTSSVAYAPSTKSKAA